MIARRSCLAVIFVLLGGLAASAAILQVGGPIGRGSPTIVDLDSDGDDEVVFGDEWGCIRAVDYDGTTVSQLWSSCRLATPIQSAPAVADINGDGRLEVVATHGTRYDATQQGYVEVLRVALNGLSAAHLWTFNVPAPLTPPDSGVFGSPTLVDLNQDGMLEVVFGSYNQYVFALRHDGSSLWYNPPPCPSFFPADYNLHPSLYSGFFVGDTIWSSPAAADIDRDGYPEIFIGIDTHNYSGWLLPFNAPDGGAVLVLDHNGQMDPDFYTPVNDGDYGPCGSAPPYAHLLDTQIEQVVWSTPALADLTGDNRLEIVFGSGEYTPYGNHRYAHAFDYAGNELWAAWIGDNTMSSPAIADINVDGQLDVVIGSQDNSMYAFRGDTGNLLPGWPVPLYPDPMIDHELVIASPILENWGGSSALEVVIPAVADLFVLGANGSTITTRNISSIAENSPGAGDLDGDGLVEVVLLYTTGQTTGVVEVLNRTTPPERMSWRQIRADAAKTGHYDTFAPGRINDLTATKTADGYHLSWTAPGDDGIYYGKAHHYELRRARFAITETIWQVATTIASPPEPALHGTNQTMDVVGLPPGDHHFALKSWDEWGNESRVSKPEGGGVLVRRLGVGDLD